MDLNTLQLSPAIITSLYKNVLYEFDDFGENNKFNGPEQAKGWKYPAGNQSNVLIVFNQVNEEQLSKDQLTFLATIFGACKISLEDIAIVNMDHQKEVLYKEIIGKFKSRQIFLLGVEPGHFGLPVNFPQFQIQPFDNCTFLFCPELDDIAADKVLKSKLWVCLQRIFSIQAA